MRPKKVDLPSVYHGKQFKKAGLPVNKFYFIGLLVILLVAFRFVNLSLWWFMGKLELTHHASTLFTKKVNYTFLDFSSYKRAEKECRELAQKHPEDNTINVAAYFNLLHPGIFLIQNNKGHSFVDLGRVIANVGPGLSTFKLYLSDFIEKQWNHKTTRTHLGTSLLFSKLFSPSSPGSQKTGDPVSFILKSPEKLAYLDIPFLLYFYLPLVFIFIFFNIYSRAVFLSFFYYPLLFLLFDFKTVLFKIPFHWIMEPLNIETTPSIEAVGAAVVASIFLLLGLIGLLNWKKRRDSFKERLIVLFFLLLPLFLRF
jgi:hypothetical protein